MGQKINPTGLRIGVIKSSVILSLKITISVSTFLRSSLLPEYPRLRSNATLSVFTSTFTALSPAWSSAARALR